MAKIKIIGLGAGDLAQMPLGVYNSLQTAMQKGQTVYLRTKEHPVVKELEKQGLHYISFDNVYDAYNEFETVYNEITTILLTAAENNEEIIYAVPGHPIVAESVVQKLLQQNVVEVELKGGHSFIDDLLQAVKLDPIDGFQLVDGLDLQIDALNLEQPLIIMQVFNDFVASDVKLALLERYPETHPVAFVHAAGTSAEKVEWCQLYELDRLRGIYNLTSVYVPALYEAKRSMQTAQKYSNQLFEKNQPTYSQLADKVGIDAEIIKTALQNEDIETLETALGDIIETVLLTTHLANSEYMFNLDDVLERLNEKLKSSLLEEE